MRKLSYFTALVMTLVIAGCGGGSENTLVNGGGAPGGGGTDPGGGGTPPDTSVFIGSGSGTGFVPGSIAVSQPSLQAGGSASLTVNFVDSSNVLVGDSITVTFSSPCAAGGLAGIIESSVTTVTGSATSTYSATGCAGADAITATANVNGLVLQATATITVEAATVGSIEFVSAEPTNIGLLGTGGAGRQETSTVRFKVSDSTGGPVADAIVDFSLNTLVGGIMLTPTSATSDVQGFVQTVVSAGSVATSVRVSAVVMGSSPVIATQSDQLTITTGIPDNDSVSLSFACVNVEGWNIDGLPSRTTMRMSDRFNNPVPDGTAVTLTTEGGQIGGSCQTTSTGAGGAGVCSVDWVSQNPRPADGRVSILATAIGEESFTDIDSNGRFNGADFEAPIGEPFRDDNEDGIRDPNEPFSDFNFNGVRDNADAPDYVGFNGLLCDPPANCSVNDTLFVSDQGVIVMSASAASIEDDVFGAITIPPGSQGTQTFTVIVGDNKGNGTTSQPMAGGTVVTATTSNGSMVGPSSFIFSCSNVNGPLSFPFAVKGDLISSGGIITIEVVSPSGISTIHSISISD